DQHEPAVRAPRGGARRETHLGLVVAVGDEIGITQAEVAGDLENRTDGGRRAHSQDSSRGRMLCATAPAPPTPAGGAARTAAAAPASEVAERAQLLFGRGVELGGRRLAGE